MINFLIDEVSNFLPLNVKKIYWDDTSLSICGDNWSFSTLSAWRMISQNKLICACYEIHAYEILKKLIGMKLYLIEVQSSHLATDPVFYFTDDSHETTIKFEIFSTLLIEPWIFESPAPLVYVPFEEPLQKNEKITTNKKRRFSIEVAEFEKNQMLYKKMKSISSRFSNMWNVLFEGHQKINKRMDQPEGLIEVLLDKSARVDERDDAAMDLSMYPCEKAIKALYEVATDNTVDKMILDSCGQSLAEIWLIYDEIDKNIVTRLAKNARYSAREYIKGYKPDWLIYFEE